MEGSSSSPLIVAMKGHPGTGKTTLARALAAALRCPLLDKDDVRDCTLLLQHQLQSSAALDSPTGAAAGMLNELSYSVLWRLAETQLLRAGLGAVVVDSPLSDRRHLDRLLGIAGRAGGRVVVVECRAADEGEWRRRLEERGRAATATTTTRGCGGGEMEEGWHKPATWEELRRLVDGYAGRADYDVGQVPRLFVDTTAADGGGVEGAVERVMGFIRSPP